MQEVAQRERKTRDLRSQLSELGSALDGEVVFQHIRTRRNLVTIYATLDGEPIPIPEYMVESAMSKTLPDGRYMFTDNKDEVPKYRHGLIKCFLHTDSSERATGILDEIGLAGKTCPAGSLSSVHSKRMHGRHRHKQEWAAYDEYMKDQKEAVQTARQERQLEATLEIARGPAVTSPGQPQTPKGACDVPGCGRRGLKNVASHKRWAHK